GTVSHLNWLPGNATIMYSTGPMPMQASSVRSERIQSPVAAAPIAAWRRPWAAASPEPDESSPSGWIATSHPIRSHRDDCRILPARWCYCSSAVAPAHGCHASEPQTPVRERERTLTSTTLPKKGMSGAEDRRRTEGGLAPADARHIGPSRRTHPTVAQ